MWESHKGISLITASQERVGTSFDLASIYSIELLNSLAPFFFVNKDTSLRNKNQRKQYIGRTETKEELRM